MLLKQSTKHGRFQSMMECESDVCHVPALLNPPVTFSFTLYTLGLEMYEEAKQKTEMMISEKRKKLKREGRGYEKIPEDDPEKKKHTVYVTVMKIFADAERRRQNLEMKDQEERKRKREKEIEEEGDREQQKEFVKNFEESREARVSSWQKFQSGESKKKKSKKSTASSSSSFLPPKVKAETRH